MRRLLMLTLALLSVPVLLLAQEAVAPPDFVDVGTKLIVAVTPVLTVVVLWGLKLLWAKIPASLLLVIGPFAGVGIDFLINYISGHPQSNPLAAAALGALATWLREFANTLITKGAFGSVSVTKGMF